MSLPPGTSRAVTETEPPAPRVAAKRAKRPKPARGDAFGILNPWGDLWTFKTFETEAWAQHYIADYWRAFPGKERVDPSKFTVIPVKVTVSAK